MISNSTDLQPSDDFSGRLQLLDTLARVNRVGEDGELVDLSPLDAIRNFVSTSKAAVGDNLAALYLTGSFVTGTFMGKDFDPKSSDIDFVAILKEPLQEEDYPKIQDSYRLLREGGKWWDTRTEAVFLPMSFCAARSSKVISHPVLKTNGDFVDSLPRNDWFVQLSTTREKGLRLIGDGNIKRIVKPVSKEFLRGSMRPESMPFVTRPESDLQMQRVTALHILSACRIAFTSTTGEIASKPKAAEWALDVYPDHSQVILSALDNRGSFEIGPIGNAYDFVDVVFGGLAEKEARNERN